MYSITTSVLSFIFASTICRAAPAPVARSPAQRGSVEPPHLHPRQATLTQIPQEEVDSFNPSTHFAAAAYCSLETTQSWTCGEHCDATPGFQTSLVGGNGGDIPHFYVGFDPTSETVVVAHQGTDPSKIKSILVDADFVPDPLDPNIFPGLPTDIKVHGGFQDAHARTAPQILQAVQNELTKRNTNKVLVAGHSLGGALALLDGVSLPLKLPPTTELKVVTYGMPRVGNKQFANYVDAHVKVTRITNRKDIVPILPPRFLGFRHSSGELHIPSSENGKMFACPGQENPDERCSLEDAENFFLTDIVDHLGPYNGITISC